MLIKVLYNNDTFDMLKHSRLDEYIAAGKVKKFRRSSGWVTIGVDHLRGAGGAYRGPERRTAMQ
jgi:hypothetical protein